MPSITPKANGNTARTVFEPTNTEYSDQLATPASTAPLINAAAAADPRAFVARNAKRNATYDAAIASAIETLTIQVMCCLACNVSDQRATALHLYRYRCCVATLESQDDKMLQASTTIA